MIYLLLPILFLIGCGDAEVDNNPCLIDGTCVPTSDYPPTETPNNPNTPNIDEDSLEETENEDVVNATPDRDWETI